MARDAADPANAQESTARGRGAYLPVLPEGWEYAVRITGPDGVIDVRPPRPDPDAGRPEWTIEVSGRRRLEGKTLTRANLADALRSAVKSVRALSKLAKYEAEADAARKALIDEIGADDTTSDAPSTHRAEAAKGVYPDR